MYPPAARTDATATSAATAAPTATGSSPNERSDTRSTLRVWPLDRRAGALWLVAYVVIFVALLGIGMSIVHLLDHSALQRMDVRVAHWFEARRTPDRNDAAQIGAGLADAYTLTPAVIILVIGFAVVWRRWHDSVMLAMSLVLEKALFLPVSLLVDRPRPPVPQLDGHPPTSSFPSGHVAAAVAAYLSLAIIVGWHTRNRAVRAAFRALAVVAPLIVAISRLHLGMHHVSDVVVGAASGLTCTLVALAIMQGAVARLAAGSQSELPPDVVRLDVSDIDRPRGELGHPRHHQRRHQIGNPA